MASKYLGKCKNTSQACFRIELCNRGLIYKWQKEYIFLVRVTSII